MTPQIQTTPQTTPSNLEEIIELTENQRMVADGPLSLIYAQTLNKLYAKEVDATTGLSLESAANDQLMLQGLWLAAKKNSDNFTEQGDSVGMLYGVRRSEVHLSDVIRVSDALSEMTDAQKSNSVIVIDAKETTGAEGSVPEVSTGIASPFEQALEDIAAYHDVRVYTSLESFLTSQKGN